MLNKIAAFLQVCATGCYKRKENGVWRCVRCGA